MSETLFVWMQRLLPQRLLGYCVRQLATCEWPAVRLPLISWFVRCYGVDLSEAERTDPEDYVSFNDLFRRVAELDGVVQ